MGQTPLQPNVVDLSQVPVQELAAELHRRTASPRLPPPTLGVPWTRRPASTLVDVVAWSHQPASRPAGHAWDRCAARLLSPVSGVDALDLSSSQDVSDAIAGLLLARPLVADPASGWSPAHRGLGARSRDEDEQRVFSTARALRWPR